MDEAKSTKTHQNQNQNKLTPQQQMYLHQQHQQKMFMLQQQIQQQQQPNSTASSSSAIARFPSNIDAHLRPPGLYSRQFNNIQSQQSQSQQLQNPNPNNNNNTNNNGGGSSSSVMQQKGVRAGNQAELHLAYQDAYRVCNPDFKTPFASLEDACQRLLPYHVVADYEAEEDDRILDSDTTGQILSRSQQWDQNITAKVGEFINTFEKQALAFNIITRKRAMGEFRSEERLMIEQALLQDEKRALLELRADLESREKAGREAHARMAVMAQPEQNRPESQPHVEMMGRGPIRGNAFGSQGNDVSIGHDMGEQEHRANQDTVNGWGNNIHRDEKEPSEDFLNDEETDNGDTGMQENWRGAGEFDLNTR